MRFAGAAAMETVQRTFAGKNPEAAIYTRKEADGIVLLAASPHRLVLYVRGAIGTEHIVGALREARAGGHFQNDDFSALVDMRDFTGVIDWRIIPQISEVMPKGDSRTNRNAYLVRNALFAMLAKINAVLFPKTQHATFDREEDARHWLGWA